MKLFILCQLIAFTFAYNLSSNVYLPLFTYDEDTNTEFYVYLDYHYTTNHNLVIKNNNQINETPWDFKF